MQIGYLLIFNLRIQKKTHTTSITLPKPKSTTTARTKQAPSWLYSRGHWHFPVCSSQCSMGQWPTSAGEQPPGETHRGGYGQNEQKLAENSAPNRLYDYHAHLQSMH